MVQDENITNLAERTNLEVLAAGGIYALSKDIRVNPGVIYRAQHGGNSPTLRRLWKVPKHPPRPRLIINCSPATIARFHRARGDMTTGQFIETLLDVYDNMYELDY